MDTEFDGREPSAHGMTKVIAETLKSHPGVASAIPHPQASRVTVVSHGGKIFVVTTRRV